MPWLWAINIVVLYLFIYYALNQKQTKKENYFASVVWFLSLFKVLDRNVPCRVRDSLGLELCTLKPFRHTTANLTFYILIISPSYEQHISL